MGKNKDKLTFMSSLGGFFGLALRRGEDYHKNALRLNSAHNCLEYMFRARNYYKVFHCITVKYY